MLDVSIDRKNEIDHTAPGSGDADAEPARTFLDYIDDLGGPVVILLLILIVGVLLL